MQLSPVSLTTRSSCHLPDHSRLRLRTVDAPEPLERGLGIRRADPRRDTEPGRDAAEGEAGAGHGAQVARHEAAVAEGRTLHARECRGDRVMEVAVVVDRTGRLEGLAAGIVVGGRAEAPSPP